MHATSPPPAARVALADPHAAMLRALHALVHGEADLEVVGHAQDASGLLGLLRNHRPNVVLLDPRVLLPRPLRALGMICASHPQTGVLLIGFDSAYAEQATAVGAAGFLHKSAPAESWLSAIRDAAARAGR